MSAIYRNKSSCEKREKKQYKIHGIQTETGVVNKHRTLKLNNHQ